MLGKTAGALYWMFRYLERSENTARLIEAGHRIALTRSSTASDEWESIITTAGVLSGFQERHDTFSEANAVDFLLRDASNPSSVRSIISAARDNARLARTALTREVWEATNECWMTLRDALARPVSARQLPDVISLIRLQSAIVRGALHGTMLRNDIYDFARIGTFLERADNTARILDVKYYILLPSAIHVGTAIDNVQWETILRSVSAERSFRWLSEGDVTPGGIADFLILDRRFPRSLAFCCAKICDNLGYLRDDYGLEVPSFDMAQCTLMTLKGHSIDSILDEGLHEFVQEFIKNANQLGHQVEIDYRFNG